MIREISLTTDGLCHQKPPIRKGLTFRIGASRPVQLYRRSRDDYLIGTYLCSRGFIRVDRLSKIYTIVITIDYLALIIQRNSRGVTRLIQMDNPDDLSAIEKIYPFW